MILVTTRRKHQQALRMVQDSVGDRIRRRLCKGIQNCFSTPQRRRAACGSIRGAPVARAPENQNQRERDDNTTADRGQSAPPFSY